MGSKFKTLSHEVMQQRWHNASFMLNSSSRPKVFCQNVLIAGGLRLLRRLSVTCINDFNYLVLIVWCLNALKLVSFLERIDPEGRAASGSKSIRFWTRIFLSPHIFDFTFLLWDNDKKRSNLQTFIWSLLVLNILHMPIFPAWHTSRRNRIFHHKTSSYLRYISDYTYLSGMKRKS